MNKVNNGSLFGMLVMWSSRCTSHLGKCSHPVILFWNPSAQWCPLSQSVFNIQMCTAKGVLSWRGVLLLFGYSIISCMSLNMNSVLRLSQSVCPIMIYLWHSYSFGESIHLCKAIKCLSPQAGALDQHHTGRTVLLVSELTGWGASAPVLL